MANTLRKWLSEATKEESERLAKYSKTSLAVLRQIAGGYRTGGSARTTPETARNIELASARITTLPVISRADLCPACAKCEYFKGKENA